MAEQEEPVRRRVALKVIKLGMDTKNVIARFEAERQALALMDHPNIAKVLDAGATETGRPYFVMELVKGVRITDYCDQNNLPTTERLALFTSVCHAIQHAHQKGIIHRDIKPSNTLVTMHDGVPVPKVIDFGIAKATDQRLTDKTLFTAFEQLMGTPAYMSPEQAEMSGLDIDTRSDIYALGVLLYELLTGKTPFDARELLASGLDAMRRTIREQEPARPSTRFSTMLAADLSAAAKHRQCESSKLTSSIRGDLDWMVMKCLEKDRTRRYETASALVNDIERHLNNEPVVARPPSRYYRLQKAIRRNKGAFAAITAIAVVLVVGAAVSTWQAVRATRSEREQSRLRAAAQQAQANEAKLRQHTEAYATELGHSQWRLAEVLVKTGRRELAEQVLREALAVFKKATQDSPNTPFFRQEQGFSRRLLGDVLSQLGRVDEAERHYRGAISLYAALAAEVPENAFYREEVGSTTRGLINLLSTHGRLIEAEAVCRAELASQKRLSSGGNPNVAYSLQLLCDILYDQAKWAEAEAPCREAIAVFRRLAQDDPKQSAYAMNLGHRQWRLADLLVKTGRRELAEQVLREASKLLEKATRDFPNDPFFRQEHGLSRRSLGDVLSELGRVDEAERQYRGAISLYAALAADVPENAFYRNDAASTTRGLVHLLRKHGKLAEAEAVCREELAWQKKLPGSGNPNVAYSLQLLADLLYDKAKWAEAEALCREAAALFKQLAQDNPKRSDYAIDLGHSQSRLAEATDRLDQAAQWKKKMAGPEKAEK